MAKFELSMPKMGESIIEATILSWTKQVGDIVELDETILEIATDKVDSEVPSPVEGKLVEQLYKEGDVVPVGAVIAIIEAIMEGEDEEDAPENGQVLHADAPPEPAVLKEIPYVPAAEPVLEKVGNGISEDRFYSPLVMNIARKEGLSMTELETMSGTGRGGRVTKKDILAYLKNQKELAAQVEEKKLEESKIEEIKVQETQVEEVKVEETIVEESKVEETIVEESKVEEPTIQETAVKETVVETPSHSFTHNPTPNAVPEAPLAEGQFEVEALEIEEIVQKIISEPQKESVPELMNNMSSNSPEATEVAETPAEKVETPAKKEETAVKKVETPTKVLPKGNYEIVEMDRMRKLIAKNMLSSTQTSAHVTSFVEADVTHVSHWRNRVKEDFHSQYGEKLTYTPIFVQAVIKALRELPLLNSSIFEDQILIKKDINIGIAVALPTDNLIVPVIKNADRLNLAGLTATINDLAFRARNNKLKPEDLEGGTYTLSNVGTFGNVMGTPIIMQPQVAILATGAIRKIPAVVETPTGDVIAIRQKMFLSHSYDHRIIDGALGGKFVKRVAEILEDWDMDMNI